MVTIEYDDLSAYNLTTPIPVVKSFIGVPLIAAFLLLGGIALSVVIIWMSIFTKSYGYGGLRMYCVNLALCGLIHIANDAMFSHTFNFSEQIQIHAFSFYNRVKPYNKKILQWNYCVYCLTTIFLLLYCMLRFGKRTNVFSLTIWAIVIFVADIVPAAYLILRQEQLSAIYFKIDPIILYHTFVLILLFILWFAYNIFTVIVCCCNYKRSYMVQSFSGPSKPMFWKSEVVLMFFYGASTIFIQLTASMMIGSGYIGLLDKKQINDLMYDSLAKHGDIASVPFYIDQWTSTSIVFIQLLAIVLFVPSYSIFHRRMIRPPSRIGHPSESFHHYNNDGTLSTVASSRAGQLPPLVISSNNTI